jgi:hypothetical protein
MEPLARQEDVRSIQKVVGGSRIVNHALGVRARLTGSSVPNPGSCFSGFSTISDVASDSGAGIAAIEASAFVN